MKLHFTCFVVVLQDLRCPGDLSLQFPFTSAMVGRVAVFRVSAQMFGHSHRRQHENMGLSILPSIGRDLVEDMSERHGCTILSFQVEGLPHLFTQERPVAANRITVTSKFYQLYGQLHLAWNKAIRSFRD